MKITMISQISGKENSLDIAITEEEYSRVLNRFNTGEYIQSIIPHIPADQREFLISGIDGEEWDQTFKYVEDDEPWIPPDSV